MGTIEKSEKPARNLAIRKFSELTTIKRLEDALTHLSEKELNDAIFSLHQNNPNDALIARKAKTLEMTKLLDEIKSLLTPYEETCLLNSLRYESLDLENQIIMTKTAISQRAQHNKLVSDILGKIQSEKELPKALALANAHLFEAIEYLSKADPALYGEKHRFILTLRDILGIKERIMLRDKEPLLKAIQSGEADTLKNTLNQAKESIRLYNLLAQYLEKYAEPHYFTKLFDKEQNEKHALAKGFFKPKLRNPAKIAHISLIEFFAEKLAYDENLTPEQKGEALYSLLTILKENASKNKMPYLVSTFEKVLAELENTTYLVKSDLETIIQSKKLDCFLSRLPSYLEGKKRTLRERKLLEIIELSVYQPLIASTEQEAATVKS
jgi:hypothetical protein